MAIRRSVWLGAGARFRLYAAPAACVVHHGFRTWATGRSPIAGYLYGIGATFGKLQRIERWRVVALLGQLAIRWAFVRPAVDLGLKPPHLLRPGAYLWRFRTEMLTAIDSKSGNYAAAR